jgi:hypothetical protein
MGQPKYCFVYLLPGQKQQMCQKVNKFPLQEGIYVPKVSINYLAFPKAVKYKSILVVQPVYTMSPHFISGFTDSS